MRRREELKKPYSEPEYELITFLGDVVTGSKDDEVVVTPDPDEPDE